MKPLQKLLFAFVALFTIVSCSEDEEKEYIGGFRYRVCVSEDLLSFCDVVLTVDSAGIMVDTPITSSDTIRRTITAYTLPATLGFNLKIREKQNPTIPTKESYTLSCSTRPYYGYTESGTKGKMHSLMEEERNEISGDMATISEYVHNDIASWSRKIYYTIKENGEVSIHGTE